MESMCAILLSGMISSFGISLVLCKSLGAISGKTQLGRFISSICLSRLSGKTSGVSYGGILRGFSFSNTPKRGLLGILFAAFASGVANSEMILR